MNTQTAQQSATPTAAKSLNDSWLTCKLLAQAEPAFTELAIRNLIFKAQDRHSSKGYSGPKF